MVRRRCGRLRGVFSWTKSFADPFLVQQICDNSGNVYTLVTIRVIKIQYTECKDLLRIGRGVQHVFVGE